MLLRICEWCESRRRAGRTLLMGVNEITLLGYRETIWHFESKERLIKLCVLRYGVNRMQSCLIFEITRISTNSAMSLMPNRFKYYNRCTSVRDNAIVKWD
jgi:hypothetical protein